MNHSKVLVSGLDGFTGQHLHKDLLGLGYDVIGLNSNLTDREQILDEIYKVSPDYVIHLAALSFAGETEVRELYDVNVQGTINLLDALKTLKSSAKKIILASSATIYGNKYADEVSEGEQPLPTNHYGCSKLAMECMAHNYFDELPIVITRPFNYTGIGHDHKFVIPKIVMAYASGEKSIELGNLDVYREFNDVRDVTKVYCELLKNAPAKSILNICSGRSICLGDVIGMLDKISDHKMQVNINEDFIRLNEIKNLCGNNSMLKNVYKNSFEYYLEDTLSWMYKYEISTRLQK